MGLARKISKLQLTLLLFAGVLAQEHLKGLLIFF